MSKGVEGGSQLPESVDSNSRLPVERGSQRFSLRRVLIGAAIGAIALPAIAFGIGIALQGGPSNIPASEIPLLVEVAIFQVAVGAAVGGLISFRRS